MRKLMSVMILGGLVSGCAAKAVVDLATLPVRAGAKAVDLATTSQAEADRNRGKEARKAEERERKKQRRRDKEDRQRED